MTDQTGIELLTLEDLKTRPKPTWVVKRILESNCLAVLFGKENTFKTFAALDLGLHVALGRDWHGQPVKAGPVIYVAGEGAFGIQQRVAAFEIKHGLKNIPNFFVVPGPVNLDSNEVGLRTHEGR